MQSLRYVSAQLVAAIEVYALQIGEGAQLPRDRARQLVVLEPQPSQSGGDVAQLTRDSARQLVGMEGQALQLGEVAQCRRDTARQSVAVEV